MSEEAAFLDALKANPADDTARLVYADWLDEHGQHAKAEYLRLVAELGRECDDAAEHPFATRLQALAEGLPAEWRGEAGSRFVVTLFGYDHVNKIRVIKVLRELTGCSLAAAKEMSEALPQRVVDCVTFEHAVEGARKLREAPSAVACVLPTELESPPYAVTYEVFVLRYLHAPASDRERVEQESREELERFLAEAVGRHAPEVPYTVFAFHTVVARGLTREAAGARTAELRDRLPEQDAESGWSLWVGHRPVMSKRNP